MRKPYQPISGDVMGVEAVVSFDFEYHDPPLPGAFGKPRITATTTCTVTTSHGNIVTRAFCSVADRYKLTKGAALALDAAAEQLWRQGVFSDAEAGIDDVQRTFAARVLPSLAREQSARRARASKPGVPALRRALRAATEEQEILRDMLTQGVTQALANIVGLAKLRAVDETLDAIMQRTEAREREPQP